MIYFVTWLKNIKVKNCAIYFSYLQKNYTSTDKHIYLLSKSVPTVLLLVLFTSLHTKIVMLARGTDGLVLQKSISLLLGLFCPSSALDGQYVNLWNLGLCLHELYISEFECIIS